MKRSTLDNAGLCTGRKGAKFVVLGKEKLARPGKRAQRKIRRETKEHVSTLWGTLGMADDSAPIWKGRLIHSKLGSTDSKKESSTYVTMAEIDHIRQGHSDNIKGDKKKAVTERFISFENVTFPAFPETFTEDEIPRLRLTLFLRSDEGALVFYQYADLQKDRKIRKQQDGSKTDGSEIEYIMPQPTQGHSCSGRDRLDYLFPILPPGKIEETRGGKLRLIKKKLKEKFVIKILTFKRENSESRTVIDRLGYHLQGHSHQLLLWNPETTAFEARDGSAVNRYAKTLFLIHGTFSETKVAYKGLLTGGRQSWLARKFGAGSGQYEQIMGFDHPTLGEGPDHNVLALLDKFPRDFQFQQPLRVITHSRGGLVAKWMAINANRLPIEKGALVACANGVGYFTLGRWVAKMLTVAKAMLKGTGHPVLAYITGLAQHSAEFFLNLPGCQAMTPGSDFLESIAAVPPPYQTPMYWPIVGDFKPRSVQGLFKRLKARGLDLLIKPILGRHHDWVVGTKKQYLMAPSTYAPGFRPSKYRRHMLGAKHSDYFYLPEVHKQLNKFL